MHKVDVGYKAKTCRNSGWQWYSWWHFSVKISLFQIWFGNAFHSDGCNQNLDSNDSTEDNFIVETRYMKFVWHVH